MPRWLTVLACLFWTPLLVLSVCSLVYDGFYPYLYYLIGIPLAMIALTLFVARFARGYPRQGITLILASVVAALAVFVIFGMLAQSV
jgi:hypothetical protein